MELDDIKQQLILHTQIKKSKLKQNEYTISLLNEAINMKVLSISEYYKIQTEIVNVLKEVIMRYTKGESTSVTIETTENLLSSIMYAIDMYTMGFENPDEALRYLRQKNIKEIYEEGIHLVKECYDDTIKLYKKINRNKLNVKVEAYNATIREAIPLFFKKYDILFGAHNTMASIDYPLALIVDDINIRGVTFIKKYLNHLRIETEFCKYFSKIDIEKMLGNFGRMIKMDYKIELLNIFELVINNAVFSILSDDNPRKLLISQEQVTYLNNKLNSTHWDDIDIIIDKAFEALKSGLHIDSEDILSYIDGYKRIFKYRLSNALKHESLNSMIVTEKAEKNKEKSILFKEANRMSNKEFNAIVKRIMNSSNVEDKIDLIKQNVHSLKDYLDLLNADCLLEDDFEAVFSMLGDMELSILTKIVFYEELRGEWIGLEDIISFGIDAIDEWKLYYVDFLQGQNKEKIQIIEEYLSELDYEEISLY